ncbi:MAG TPA: GFA family protein [Thermoanaerobaculia bacterium]|nr:GFA family protein [Thermoanaerobaculia bacterium]
MPRLTGKCLCGKVRYSVENKFDYFVYCHCKQCQESTGSAFNAAAGIGQNKFTVTAGEENLTSYNKSNVDGTISVVKFCKTCGSSLFSIKTKPDNPEEKFIQVRMGTLGGTPERFPEAHVWVSENAPWFDIQGQQPCLQFKEAATLTKLPEPGLA